MKNHIPGRTMNVSFACIGSTKSGRRAEEAERDFTSSVIVRHRLLPNRENHRRNAPVF